LLATLSSAYFFAEVVPEILQRRHLAAAARVGEVYGVASRTEGRLLQLEGHGTKPFRLSDDSPIIEPGEVVALEKAGDRYQAAAIWGIYEGRKPHNYPR